MAFFIQTKPIPPQAGNRRSSAMRKALMELPAGSNKCVTLFVEDGADIKALRNRISGAVNALRKQHGAQFVTRTIKEVRPNDDGTRGQGEPEDCVAIWKIADKPEETEPETAPDDAAKPANPKATASKPAAKAATDDREEAQDDMLAGLD